MTDHSDLIEQLSKAAYDERWADTLEIEVSKRAVIAAASALSSQSLSLSEAIREKSHWLGEARRTLKAGQEALDRAESAERQRDEALEALKPFAKVAERYDGVEHVRRQPALEAHLFDITIDHLRRAKSALENRKADLADATNDPASSDLSSLRKGAEEIEVTDEMIEAGKEAANGWTDRYMDGAEFVNWDEALPDIFRRMLALVSGSREDGDG